MKIIFFSAAKSFGGGERYLLLIIPILQSLEYEVKLVFSTDKVPFELSNYATNHYSISNDDVIIFNGLGALYKWGLTIPHINKSFFLQHSLLSDGQSGLLKKFIRPFLLKYYLRYITHVIRVCDSALDSKYHPKIHTIHNGVDVIRTVPIIRRNDNFILGMLGSVNENKNQEQIIRLLPYLNHNIKLKIVGDGVIIPKLKKIASNLHVSNRIIWVGKSNTPLVEISSVHVLLVLSKSEALPFAALEAMSSAIPVISSNVGGMMELIKPGFNGFLFEYNNNDDLFKYINILYEDDKLRCNLGFNSCLTIKNNFSTKKMVNQFIDLINS